MQLTKLVGEPQVICQEVRHVVIQALQHLQGVVYEEDGVVIPVQHPLEVVIAMQVGGQEGCYPSPAHTHTCTHMSYVTST